MSDVSKINDQPIRYLVTLSVSPIMDNRVMSVVEQRFDPFDSVHFFWCKRHKSASCECTRAVQRFRDDAGLNDNKDAA